MTISEEWPLRRAAFLLVREQAGWSEESRRHARIFRGE